MPRGCCSLFRIVRIIIASTICSHKMYVMSLPCTKALPIGLATIRVKRAVNVAVIVNSDLYADPFLFIIIH